MLGRYDDFVVGVFGEEEGGGEASHAGAARISVLFDMPFETVSYPITTMFLR